MLRPEVLQVPPREGEFLLAYFNKGEHQFLPHIDRALRLLDLPQGVRSLLADGRLSMGHARALITSPDAEALAEQVVSQDLSVRDTEALAKRARPAGKGDGRPASVPAAPPVADADIQALERQIGDILGLKVQIEHTDKGGKVSIGYSTLDQLDLVCQRLSGEPI